MFDISEKMNINEMDSVDNVLCVKKTMFCLPTRFDKLSNKIKKHHNK